MVIVYFVVGIPGELLGIGAEEFGIVEAFVIALAAADKTDFLVVHIAAHGFEGVI